MCRKLEDTVFVIKILRMEKKKETLWLLGAWSTFVRRKVD
jgi:hypothetical protein